MFSGFVAGSSYRLVYPYQNPMTGAVSLLYTPCIPTLLTNPTAIVDVRNALETVFGLNSVTLKVLESTSAVSSYRITFSGLNDGGYELLEKDPLNDLTGANPTMCVAGHPDDDISINTATSPNGLGVFEGFEIDRPYTGSNLASTVEVPFFALPNLISVATSQPLVYTLELTSGAWGLSLDLSAWSWTASNSVALPASGAACYSKDTLASDIESAITKSLLTNGGSLITGTDRVSYVTRQSYTSGTPPVTKVIYKFFFPAILTEAALISQPILILNPACSSQDALITRSNSGTLPTGTIGSNYGPLWSVPSSDFSYDPVTTSTLIPLANPFAVTSLGAPNRLYTKGTITLLPGEYSIYRATGLAREITFATNLGDVPALNAAFKTTLTGAAPASVNITDNVLTGYLPKSATIHDLRDGVEYFCRVSASNGLSVAAGGGLGPWSLLASAVPMSKPQPPRDMFLKPIRRMYESQRIYATSSRVAAVQQISTRSDAITEVQSIQTSASMGTTLSGTFALSFNSIRTDQGFFEARITSNGRLAPGKGGFRFQIAQHVSTCVTWDTPAEGTGSVAKAIEMIKTGVNPDVFPITYANEGLRVKRIETFKPADSTQLADKHEVKFFIYYDTLSAPMISTTTDFDLDFSPDCGDFEAAPLAASPSVSATVSGSFKPRLPFDYDVLPSIIETRLEEHPDLVDVFVLQTLASEVGGYYYTVSFTETTNDYGLSSKLNPRLPLMTCDDSALVTTPPSGGSTGIAGPSCLVFRDVQRNLVEGTFFLTITDPVGGQSLSTVNLDKDASSSDIETALANALYPIVSPARVSRTVEPDMQGGYTWMVTFSIGGPVPLLKATANFEGSGSSISITNVIEGNSLGGSFTLRYAQRETRPIPWNASAVQMKSFLEALATPPIELVKVSRSAAYPAPVGGISTAPAGEGYMWDVTFSTQQDVSLGLSVGSTNALSGIGARVIVRELRKGARESASSLSVSFSAPTFNGGFPISRYDIDYDVSPTFTSTSPSDRGSIQLADSDLLFGTQVISIAVGSGVGDVGSGCTSITGTFRLQYGSSPAVLGLTAAQLAARRTSALSADVSADEVRMALESLDSITSVSVQQFESRIQLVDLAATVTEPRTVIKAEVYPLSTDKVILSTTFLPDNQLKVGDSFWLTSPNTPFADALKFKVRAKVADASMGQRIVLSLGSPLQSSTQVHLPDSLASASLITPLNVFASGRGTSFLVSITGLEPSTAKPQALYAPQPQLVCRDINSIASLSPPSSLGISVAHEPCNACVHLPYTLLKGQNYFARIFATNQVGRSLIAAVPPALLGTNSRSEIPRTVPSPPMTVAISALSDSQMDVAWSLPADDGRGDSHALAVSGYLIEWDRKATFNSGGADPKIPGASLPLGSYVVTGSELSKLKESGPPPYHYAIGGFTNGTVLFVRAAAIGIDAPFDDNRLWSENGDQPYEINIGWAYSVPSSVATAFQPPSAPVAVEIQLLTSTSLRVTLSPSIFDGGLPITRYEIAIALTAGGFSSPLAEVFSIDLDKWLPLESPIGSSIALKGKQLYDLTGRKPGVSYFVRVRAINAAGASKWTLSSPSFDIPRGKPAAPALARISSPALRAGETLTSLDIAWGAAPSMSGSVINGYVVEIWSDRVIYEVQRLRVHNSHGRSDIRCLVSDPCYLQLRIAGSITVNFPLDESAMDLRHHLMTTLKAGSASDFILPNIDVTREVLGEGYEWAITFSGPPGRLNDASGLGNVPEILLGESTAFHSSSQNSLSECGTIDIATQAQRTDHDNSCISISLSTEVQGARRYGRGETQVMTIAANDGSNVLVDGDVLYSGGVTGWFRIGLTAPVSISLPAITPTSDTFTPYIPNDASASFIEEVVNQLPGVRGVKVTRLELSNVAITASFINGSFTQFASGEVIDMKKLNNVVSINDGTNAGGWDGFRLIFSFPRQDGDVFGLILDSEKLSTMQTTYRLLAISSDAENQQTEFGVSKCLGCLIGERPQDYSVIAFPPTVLSASIGNLTAGRRYYAQISAQNDRGVGEARLATCSPAASGACSPDINSPFVLIGAVGTNNAGVISDPFGIRLPLQAPLPPTNVSMDIDHAGDSSALVIRYDKPLNNGGSKIRSFRVEWSTVADFSSGAIGRQDYECAEAAARHVISLTQSADGRGISNNGLFFLTITHEGESYRTQDVRVNAEATSSSESGLNVFCESNAWNSVIPITSPVVACTGRPGSLESALTALPFIKEGVRVSKVPLPSGARNEYTWIITFLDDGGDWNVVPTAVSLQAADDQSSLTSSVFETAIVTMGVPAEDLKNCVSYPVKITGLVQGTNYYMRVYAYNAVGYSSPSSAKSVRTQALFQAPMRSPGRPTSVALSVRSGSELRITWSPPTDTGGESISSYSIEWGTELNNGVLTGGGVVVVTYLPDNGPYAKSISGLSMGVRYFLRVSACNSVGCGQPQQSTPTREHPRQLPKSPTIVRLEPTSPSMVTVSFSPPTSNGGDTVTSYRVEWDIDPEFESSARPPLKGSAVVPAPWPGSSGSNITQDAAATGDVSLSRTGFYTISQLNAGTMTYVRVSACNRVGCGAASYDVPAGEAPRKQVAGKPYDLKVSQVPQGGSCRSIRVSFLPPVIPAHGLFCFGGSGSPPQPDPCPAGMGFGRIADGGVPISSYEIQFSTRADFSDIVTDGGVVAVPVATGDQALPVEVNLGPGVGANLQPGTRYYVRVAARQGVGVGPLCSREGVECDGIATSALPSAAC